MPHDPRREPLTASGSEAEIERLIGEVALPLVRQIVGRETLTRGGLPRHDADDIEATVTLRLLRRLRQASASPDDAIQDLGKYVTTLTYNAINDHLRRRFPERTRLKNRLRYVLTHDRRLALWTVPAGLAAGLRKWSGATDVLPSVPLDGSRATRTMLDRSRPGDALAALFDVAARPVELESLIDWIASVWHVVDIAPVTNSELATHETAPVQLERRELLRLLWREIQQLRPMQRKALLLNLRDEETVNVVSLVVLTGTAKFDDVAAALEMAPQELAAIWNDLPLDDLQIGELLQVTRQQVINLRKSARERLARRVYRS